MARTVKNTLPLITSFDEYTNGDRTVLMNQGRHRWLIFASGAVLVVLCIGFIVALKLQKKSAPAEETVASMEDAASAAPLAPPVDPAQAPQPKVEAPLPALPIAPPTIVAQDEAPATVQTTRTKRKTTKKSHKSTRSTRKESKRRKTHHK